MAANHPTVVAYTPVEPPARAALEPMSRSRPLLSWLVDDALPLWATTGVDRQGGGFFEKIDLQGLPVEEPRRARVVARQIYVFATAERRGWLASADALVEHGLAFLFGRLRQAGGAIAAAVDVDGNPVRTDFDLYEHAFVLFALASACRGRPDRAHLRTEAESILGRMRSGWGHPAGGFDEARPRTLPLKSNPHMHLLEAALAWAEISSGAEQRMWRALGAEIVELCLRRFIDGEGAVHEYFDADWQHMAGPQGRVVEPGHQFEWAWLLLRWAAHEQSTAAADAGRRLLSIGEAHGVDPVRGVAVNEIDDEFEVIDAAAKVWPQTERVKAWHLAASAATQPPVEGAAAALDKAVRGLSQYVLESPRGLWREQLAADGRFVSEDCRASSLYHIVCAIDVLTDDAVADRLPTAGPPA